MDNSAKNVYRRLNRGDVTVVHVDFDNDYYQIGYLAGNQYDDLPREGKYSDSISGILPLFWSVNEVASFDIDRMKRVLSVEYIRAAYRMGRYVYAEYFDVFFANGDKRTLKVKIQLDSSETSGCIATLIYGLINLSGDSTCNREFSNVWDNLDDYTFVHELDMSEKKVIPIKYPEKYLPEIQNVDIDYDKCMELYVHNFSNELDAPKMRDSFDFDRVFKELQTKGFYSVDIRFTRKNGKAEWYEVNYVLSEKHSNKAILTVKNIEQVVRVKMESEVRHASYDDAYICTIYNNLTRNTYSVMSGKDLVPSGAPQEFDKMLELMASRMDEESHDRFLQEINRERLIEQCLHHEEFSIELEDFEYYGKKRDVQIIFKRVNNIKDEVCCALVVRDIHSRTLEKREKMLQQNILGVALEKMYSTVLMINITKDEYRTLYDSADTNIVIPQNGTISSLYKKMNTKIDPEFQEEFDERFDLDELRRAAENRLPNIIMKYRRLTVDGEYEWMKIQTIFIDNPVNTDKVALVFVTDIEEEMQKELKLRHALDTAEKASRAKTEFLFNVSHDIRTPMNAIMGYSEMIAERVDDFKFVSETIDKVRNSSTYMLNLLNNILSMSSIETNKEVLNYVPTHMGKMLDTVESMIQPMAEKKHVKFTFEQKDIVNDIVLTDAPKLEQIAMNIIGNAIKFTKEGNAVNVLCYHCDSDCEDSIGYCFECKDEGIGIPAEYMDKIFEPFVRANNTIIGQNEGTGLGLAITKKLVEMMGGRITLESKEGEGTVVRVFLTFKKTMAEPEKPIRQTLNSLPNFHGIRILAAEDKLVNYEVLRLMMERFNVQMERAENGQEAVRMVEESEEGYYQLILMDIQMPIMNGYQATEKIKQLPRKDIQSIPIIAMTANTAPEDVQNALDVGMVGHIGKPISKDKIYQELIKHVTID